MDLEYKPLNFEHIRYIEVNDAQKTEQTAMLISYGSYAAQCPGLEVWAGNRCLGAAGLIPVYPSRFLMAWALLSRHSGPHMVAITKMARRMLDAQRAERIEMTVSADFAVAQRWAELLGFERETATPLRKRNPSGGDEYIYARVR